MAFSSKNESISLISESDNIENELPFTCDETNDVSNLTDQEINDMILYSRSKILQVKVIIPVIFTFGILGNMAFFLLLARVKMMGTMTTFYLANLAAAADIMVLFLEMLYKAWKFIDSIVLKGDPFRTRFWMWSILFCH